MRISDWSSDVCSSDLAERFAPGLQRRQARGGRAWRRVAAVQEGVHGHLRHAGAMRELQHREDLRPMAVHAAGREQAPDVQGAAALHHLTGPAPPRVVAERTEDRRADTEGGGTWGTR